MLFIARAISGYLLAINEGKLPLLYSNFLYTISLISLAIFLLVNREELDSFNIDKYVVYTFLLSSIGLFLSFGISLPWIAAIVCSYIIGNALFKSKFKIGLHTNLGYMLLYIVIGILPELVLKLIPSNLYQNYKFFAGLSAGTIVAITSITLWNVMFEELLFRGILWKILIDLKFSNKKVILTQAFLFWLVHIDFIMSKSLGVNVFIFGVWVGFLTLRSNSLTPSIATHFVHNITSRLF